MDEYEERLIDQAEEDTFEARQDSRKVVLWLLEERPKARLYSTLPPGEKDAKKIWIPRSQIVSQAKDPHKTGEIPRCIVDIKEWLLEKKGL